MAVPEDAQLATNVAREAAPLISDDLQVYIDAIGSTLADVEEMARDDEDDNPGWSHAVSVELAPARLLQWLGQLYGVRVTPGDPTDPVWVAKAKAEIVNSAGPQRGTPAAMRTAIEATLTGTKLVRIVERVDGNAYRLTVVTKTSETADVAATERAAISQKPAGLVLSYYASDLPLIDEWSRTIDSTTETIDSLTLAGVS